MHLVELATEVIELSFLDPYGDEVRVGAPKGTLDEKHRNQKRYGNGCRSHVPLRGEADRCL
jgi:hypothetical protein